MCVTEIVVACVQLAPVLGDYAANQAQIADAVRRAAAAGAAVVVVPELATSGYVFSSAEEARAAARPAAEALAPWVEVARETGTIIAGGFAELAGPDSLAASEELAAAGPVAAPDGLAAPGDVAAAGAVFNSAAIVDGAGVLAVYRKVHLWDRESLVFAAGSAPPPVIDTPAGRLGLCVCYDIEFPEFPRSLALRGADLICVPTNWPDEGRPPGERPLEVVRAMAAASSSKVFIACADRCGAERGVDWVGGSAIAAETGWLLAGPATPEPTLLTARCNLARARDKRLNERNDVFADRRPDVYAQAPLDS
jgi:predicted amidohydrolase